MTRTSTGSNQRVGIEVCYSALRDREARFSEGAAMVPSTLVVCGVVGCIDKIGRMVP